MSMILKNTIFESKLFRPFLCVSILLIVILTVTVAIVAYQCYLIEQNDRLNNEDYLRKLVNDVNQRSELNWNAKFNRFGDRVYQCNFFNQEINESAVTQIIAQLNHFFHSSLMKEHLRQLQEISDEQLPNEFDARLHWPHCLSISDVPNQGGCGSCYAVAAGGVASDRACIASNSTQQQQLQQRLLSYADIVDCCQFCGNCQGGDPLKALIYWVNEGLVTGDRDGCKPYRMDIECGVPCSPNTFSNGERYRKCEQSCQKIYSKNEYHDDKHHASIAYSMHPRMMSLDGTASRRQLLPSVIEYLSNVAKKPLTRLQVLRILMKEMFLFGPITMTFPVTEEFLHYTNGVFTPYPFENITDRIIYWHVVRLIGWGHTPDGSFHWLAVNSFGRHWGENGLFRIDTKLFEIYGLEFEAAQV